MKVLTGSKKLLISPAQDNSFCNCRRGPRLRGLILLKGLILPANQQYAAVVPLAGAIPPSPGQAMASPAGDRAPSRPVYAETIGSFPPSLYFCDVAGLAEVGLHFEARGRHALKGLLEVVQLYTAMTGGCASPSNQASQRILHKSFCFKSATLVPRSQNGRNGTKTGPFQNAKLSDREGASREGLVARG